MGQIEVLPQAASWLSFEDWTGDRTRLAGRHQDQEEDDRNDNNTSGWSSLTRRWTGSSHRVRRRQITSRSKSRIRAASGPALISHLDMALDQRPRILARTDLSFDFSQPFMDAVQLLQQILALGDQRFPSAAAVWRAEFPDKRKDLRAIDVLPN